MHTLKLFLRTLFFVSIVIGSVLSFIIYKPNKSITNKLYEDGNQSKTSTKEPYHQLDSSLGIQTTFNNLQVHNIPKEDSDNAQINTTYSVPGQDFNLSLQTPVDKKDIFLELPLPSRNTDVSQKSSECSVKNQRSVSTKFQSRNNSQLPALCEDLIHTLHNTGSHVSLCEAWLSARYDFWSGNILATEMAYRILIDRYPNNPDLPGELGNIYLNLGLWKEAVSAYYEASMRVLHSARKPE